jgi:ribosomal protein S27AE
MAADERAEPARPALYWRCGACSLVAPYSSADWVIDMNDPARGIDWSRPVEAKCGICYTKTDLTRDQVLPLDATEACPRCGTEVPCPTQAHRVDCVNCGLIFFGPGADTAAKRDEVSIQEGLTNVALRAAYLRARGGR